MDKNEIAILVVDDEESARHILMLYLTKNGYRCTAACSAEEAMVLLKTNLFNVVLTDIAMPGASGFDLAKYISSGYPKTAVVMMTGLSDTKYVSQAVRLGVQACLIKPFNLDQVGASIEKAVRHQALIAGLPLPDTAQQYVTVN